ncbi:bifunctional aspartate kinase/homoserine dehydrogenase I [Salisaeta longa]|uniref:bifunctional aspartate kinase/homoserine dehydrogenase I n=1 Tax=Salisaeta longa TaxID=503170 RepID=UPI0003B6785C|nr:bifunctional aspartate kinase/homoserine dehydrogenase I [Salisaeta longa]
MTAPSSAAWAVYKFGGTSLATPDRLLRAARLVHEAGRPIATVVSAMGGVTDRLLDLAQAAPTADAPPLEPLDALIADQRAAATALLDDPAAVHAQLATDRDAIADVLRTMQHLRAVPPAAHALIGGFGEQWSARLLTGVLRAQGKTVGLLDARDVLIVSHERTGPSVDWDATRRRFNAWRAEHPSIDHAVVTGFIASTPAGVPTTLGRNGSDVSAALFGVLFDAHSVTIWTDVDGVMSANPRYVPDAQPLDALSYDEALELAYFGAHVIHPRTLAPVMAHNLPLIIRNTFNPEAPGTRIDATGTEDRLVKGFSTIDDVALLTLEGTGMMGVPGTARRLFDALEAAGISVILISQGSSEHSICFAVPTAEADTAAEVANDAFYAAIDRGHVQPVRVAPDCSILAVVGQQMSGTPGVAATFFSALAHAGVNVRAIAQGASERNISAVVDRDAAQRALRAAHAGFYLSPRTVSIGIIGAGNVGAALVEQIHAERERLLRDHTIDLRVRGLCTSRQMLCGATHLDLSTWHHDLNAAPATDLDAFVDHVHSEAYPHTVLVDCTASGAVADRYAGWLQRGIHVVTPNKRASTAPWTDYLRLHRAREHRARYLYETTVGAGLPILQTLHNLIETGDRVHHIEGILSGTLSYLFNAFDGERPFSAILQQAKDEGFTEPDPRDDLSGMDVARKVVILAREMGIPLEVGDVSVDGLVPDALTDGPVEDFMDALPAYDDEMTDILRTAQAEGKVLRFVGRVDAEGNASVRLRRYDAEHPFARINHTDNIVRFQTDRYATNPLIVQGPGAGPRVTAAGVFADILRLLQ